MSPVSPGCGGDHPARSREISGWRLGLLAGLLGGSVAVSGQGSPPLSQPLVRKQDFRYLGAFALPQARVGDSYFNYGGHALCPCPDPVTGKPTLYMEGHAWYPGEVAQVEVPSQFVDSADWDDLPMALVLQPFREITDGHMDTAGNYTTFIYGMLAYHDRLIVAASEYYDADGSQVNTHGVSSFDLGRSDDFEGFYPLDAVASPRSLGGYMTTIPAEWRDLFGGPALTGQCCLSIIGNGSSGPAATVFDPDDVGALDPIPATTVLYYPLSHPLAPGDTQNPWFNLATQIPGIAFPPGSRSVLFLGRHGTGPYCYGTGEDCHDPVDDSKGTHSYPYQHQVWAYDAAELLAVRNSQKQPWEVRPYAIWTLDEMDTSGGAKITGAGYDPETSRWYIAQAFGDFPRIDVYQVVVVAPPTLVIRRVAEDRLEIELQTGAGQPGAIEVSDDLVHWTELAIGIADGAGRLAHTEQAEGERARCFRGRVASVP